jgi:predicted RNA-binding protein with PIN domain
MVEICTESEHAMDLIVDGYNLIGAEQGLGGLLEPKRNWLVQRLSTYRKIKQFNLTVVFDGWRTGAGEETRQTRDGVSIVYSRFGEKADEVIIRLARGKGGGSVVITSDREIQKAVERFGAVAVSSDEFSRILRSVDGGGEQAPEDDEFDHPNPNRGSKPERRRNQKLRKLRL